MTTTKLPQRPSQKLLRSILLMMSIYSFHPFPRTTQQSRRESTSARFLARIRGPICQASSLRQLTSYSTTSMVTGLITTMADT